MFLLLFSCHAVNICFCRGSWVQSSPGRLTFLGCEGRLTYCLYPLALCTVTISTSGLGGCSDAHRPWNWAVSRAQTILRCCCRVVCGGSSPEDRPTKSRPWSCLCAHVGSFPPASGWVLNLASTQLVPPNKQS